MKKLTADQWVRLVQARVSAFKAIAEALGKDHPLTKMMGPLAWGRHDAEWGPDLNLRKAVYAVGFLDGAFRQLNLWARDHDTKAQTVMLRLYPRGFFVPG